MHYVDKRDLLFEQELALPLVRYGLCRHTQVLLLHGYHPPLVEKVDQGLAVGSLVLLDALCCRLHTVFDFARRVSRVV
jgi:hypothetical protein